MEKRDNEPTGADLPDLYVSVLSDDLIAEYFNDLTACSDVQCRFKTDAKGYVDNTVYGLPAGLEIWLNGNTYSMQCIYAWEGSVWCDTLKREQAGTRLIRVKRDWET